VDHFIESLRISATRFSDAVRRGPLDAPVAACPGWTLTDLTHHMGMIHRWARLAVLTSAPPDQAAIEPPPTAAESSGQVLGDWIDVGAASLIDSLAEIEPDAPTWHPFPVARVAAVWPRRQAHETQVHAWDAERAVGETSPLDPHIALDGIAEYFEVIVPRVIKRSNRTAPVGTLTIQCVDADGRLVIQSLDGEEIHVERVPADDAARSPMLWGPAEGLLLALWGRAEHPVRADDGLVSRWLAFGGN
jgi:uncharacterized protein (TIGR03083 family)